MELRNHASEPAAIPAEGTGSEPVVTRTGLAAWFKLARPKQWLKNVLVVAAPGAAGVLFHADAIWKTAVAFVCFCLAASGIYYINDAIDVEADRMHPKKRHRPIAAGAITPRAAITGGVVFLVASIGLAFTASWELAAVIAGYLVLQVSYSMWLKNEAVIDLAAVAAGFVLRTIAGGLAVGVPISTWFLIVAGSGSFFMVTGKRHAELLELGDDAAGHRRALDVYSHSYLNYVRAVSSSVAILAYCLWAFEKAGVGALTAVNSQSVGQPAWFELSIVPFVLGILRYALLLEQGKGGAPEELVLSDRTLQVIGLMWAALFAIAIHGS